MCFGKIALQWRATEFDGMPNHIFHIQEKLLAVYLSPIMQNIVAQIKSECAKFAFSFLSPVVANSYE